MKVFISYKANGEDENTMQKNLHAVSEVITSCGHSTFCYNRDVKHGENWFNKNNREIITRCFSELSQCDSVFAYVDSGEKSEGMLLEAGFACAHGKPIILAINKKLNPDTVRFLRSLATETIEFESLSDLEDKSKSVFLKHNKS
jgi:nucleoside 2-deoxyribosyltransferase